MSFSATAATDEEIWNSWLESLGEDVIRKQQIELDKIKRQHQQNQQAAANDTGSAPASPTPAAVVATRRSTCSGAPTHMPVSVKLKDGRCIRVDLSDDVRSSASASAAATVTTAGGIKTRSSTSNSKSPESKDEKADDRSDDYSGDRDRECSLGGDRAKSSSSARQKENNPPADRIGNGGRIATLSAASASATAAAAVRAGCSGRNSLSPPSVEASVGDGGSSKSSIASGKRRRGRNDNDGNGDDSSSSHSSSCSSSTSSRRATASKSSNKKRKCQSRKNASPRKTCLSRRRSKSLDSEVGQADTRYDRDARDDLYDEDARDDCERSDLADERTNSVICSISAPCAGELGDETENESPMSGSLSFSSSSSSSAAGDAGDEGTGDTDHEFSRSSESDYDSEEDSSSVRGSSDDCDESTIYATHPDSGEEIAVRIIDPALRARIPEGAGKEVAVKVASEGDYVDAPYPQFLPDALSKR